MYLDLRETGTPIQAEFMRSEGIVRGMYREIFYVRYIDW